MPQFSLTTIWNIPAPIERVWFCLLDTENWTTWWQHVSQVEEVNLGEASGLYNTRRYLWRTYLPYSLMFTLQVTELQIYQFIRVTVTGDLKGDGSCRLVTLTADHTQIEFNWQVSTCKTWMNYLTWLSPLFIWNHTKVMQNGEQSLIRYLNTKKI